MTATEASGTQGDQGESPRRRLPSVRDLLRIAIIPLAAVGAGLVVGAIVMLLSSLATGGLNITLPIVAYGSLFSAAFGSLNGIFFTLISATPLILGGLAVGLGFKAGLFNIGAQGQYLIGALGAAGVGAAVANQAGFIAIPVAILAGALAGAAWGFIPGALKAWTGAHEVVTTIMLNSIAGAVISYLVTGPLLAPGASFAQTGPIGNAELPIIFGSQGHLGVFIALAAVPVVWWILWKSTLGFEIRTVGANPDAARYAGMRPALITILTMSACGMLAGLAGAGQILGITHFMQASYGTAVGFDSISVALIGRAHPFGILFAALLFGAMRAGSGLMQIQAGIPSEIIDVISASILLFLAADVIVRRLIGIRRAKGVELDELQTVSRTYGGTR